VLATLLAAAAVMPLIGHLLPAGASDDVDDLLLLTCLARGFEGVVLFAPPGTSQRMEVELRVAP